MGLLGYDATSPSETGTDVTYDNYNAFTPAAGAMGPTVAHLAPAPLQPATAVYPTVFVAILNRDTPVDTNSIQLWFDGEVIPQDALI